MKRKKGKKEKKERKEKNPYYTHVCRRQRPRFTQCKPHHVYTRWCLEAEKGRSLPAAGAQQQTRGTKPDTDSLKCIAILQNLVSYVQGGPKKWSHRLVATILSSPNRFLV